MKITYDEQGKVTEILFAEGEDQKAFWEFMQNRDNAYKETMISKNSTYKEMCINRDNVYKETCIAREKEITERNKGFINTQFSYMGYNGLPNIN